VRNLVQLEDVFDPVPQVDEFKLHHDDHYQGLREREGLP
jgi:hypothetical protein